MHQVIKNIQASLTKKILMGMVLGLVVGLFLNFFQNHDLVKIYILDGLLQIIGSIFLSSLQVLVVPLVFVSLVCGTASLEDITKLGRIGGKTFALYLLTTAIAISLAILFALFFEPGVGLNLKTDLSFNAKEAPSIAHVLMNIFPKNPVAAMAEGNMLQIIVFSILFGIAISFSGDSGKRILSGFNKTNDVLMNLVLVIFYIAPIGIFAQMAKTFATQGFDAIFTLGKYFFVVLGFLLVHMLVTYPLILKVMANLNPIIFFKKFRQVWVIAFSTSSSNATLPVNLEVVEKDLGVSPKVASFSIPLGATINMDGTAIMQGVATVFIGQVYGIDIGLGGYITVILMATLASIGTAGVPGVGLITLTMVLKQVGLPVEGIALIIGIDRLLDMSRTAVNVTGDAIISCIVAKSEKELNEATYSS